MSAGDVPLAYCSVHGAGPQHDIALRHLKTRDTTPVTCDQQRALILLHIQPISDEDGLCGVFTTTIRLRFDGRSTAYQLSEVTKVIVT